MKSIVISLLLFSSCLTAFSQDPVRTSQKNTDIPYLNRPNSLAISGTLEGELLLFYERRIGRKHAIEAGIGKKWSDNQSSLSNKTDQAGLYAGEFYNLAYRFYFMQKERTALYATSLFFYKDYAFNKKLIAHAQSSNETYYSTQIRSSKKEVMGVKLLVGTKIHIPIRVTKETPLFFTMDFYTGIGLRNKYFEDTLYAKGDSDSKTECDCITLDPPQKEGNPDDIETIGIPSVHLGAKFGLSF